MVLGVASMAHLVFSMLLMLSRRRQLLGRSFANVILLVTFLMTLASLRFVLDGGQSGFMGLWYDFVGDGAAIVATSFLLVIVDRCQERQRHLAHSLWPVGLWLVAWTSHQMQPLEDLRSFVQNA